MDTPTTRVTDITIAGQIVVVGMDRRLYASDGNRIIGTIPHTFVMDVKDWPTIKEAIDNALEGLIDDDTEA